MTEQLPFAGLMDLDNATDTIQPGYHVSARNVLFKGVGQKRAEMLKGLRQVAYTLPSGTNEVLWSYYDSTKLRTIWFNYNSNNNHGIYQMINEVVTPITVCGGTDYLNFNLTTPIHSVDILYADGGDILYFIDCLKRPTKINIDRAIAGGYGTMQRSFLDVAKEPLSKAPVVAYADDLSATVNNLTKSLFQFAAIFVFDDKEESVLSAFSEVPVPPGFLNQNAAVTTNAKITVQIPTGAANVKKIKICARQNIESVFDDWRVIATLDKTVLSIGDNTTYTYDFKNNSTGIALDPKYATLPYDYVPREANTQGLLNGNIVVYARVKEGYNNDITPNITFTVDTLVDPGGATDITQTYSFWSDYTFGLVYFDDKGRTNGVLETTKRNVSTGADPGTIFQYTPKINFSITHRPPLWAKTYQWVRTKNNTKSKFLQWISETTIKDDKFAYIGVQNIYRRNSDDKSRNAISYDFTPGDRIRFIGLGTFGSVLGQDFAIEDFVNSPEVGYIQRSGYFVKIKLPTTSSSFDFGTAGFGSYYIELYTPAQVATGNLNPFFEFGEVYQIGNPGLSNRYHMGATQNQAADLSLPATFSFTKGDAYLKSRDIATGGVGKYKTNSGDAWDSLMLVGCALVSNTITNETYELGATPFQHPLPPYNNDAYWIIKTHGDPYTFTVRGTIKINSPSAITYRVYFDLVNSGGTTFQQVDIIPNYYIAVGDNTIPFTATVTMPPNTKAFMVTDNSASAAIHYYETEFEISSGVVHSRKFADPNFSDSFPSAINSNGRPFIVDDSLVETTKDIIRFSEAYQSNTNINRTNRFYDLNYIDYDKSRGIAQRIKVRGDIMRLFQHRGVSPFGVFKQMLTGADGSENLIQSEKVLSKIKPYDGEFGIGDNVCSLASSAGADYFTDPTHGHVRVAGDGMNPVSKLYKAQYYMPPIASLYGKGYTTDSGAKSKIIGVFDLFNDEFVSVFQKCKSGSTVIYTGDSLGFNETRNGYSSHYDYLPESIVCAENTFIMFKSGALYIQDSSTVNLFFGTSFPSTITLVANKDSNVKKEFLSIGYHSDKVWDCPAIVTETGQQSNLVAGDLVSNEGMVTAAFGRDINSPGGWSEGDYLVGVNCKITLQNAGSVASFLTGLYINYLIRPKTF